MRRIYRMLDDLHKSPLHPHNFAIFVLTYVDIHRNIRLREETDNGVVAGGVDSGPEEAIRQDRRTDGGIVPAGSRGVFEAEGVAGRRDKP